ncbi:MAG: triose-phosphate isomerase [Burkholderiaceae bacterium]|jgi:triosephosphate isomerase
MTINKRQKIVAGNWKMNGSIASNEALLAAVNAIELPSNVSGVVCAPFPYLFQLQGFLGSTHWQWGAQDVSPETIGPFTGDVSALMLREFGCSHVLVGHSERRALHAETALLVARKAYTALANQLTPIVCFGETLSEREAALTFEVLAKQLDPVIELCSHFVSNGKWSLVVAYEPVWAIGTGRTATPEQAQEVHAWLRGRLQTALGLDLAATTPILYGGSVKSANSVDLFAQHDIDGFLVGGASLDAADFAGIVSAALG